MFIPSNVRVILCPSLFWQELYKVLYLEYNVQLIQNKTDVKIKLY